MDLTSSIANLSIGLSQQNLATQFSTKMLSKTMESSEIIADQLIENLETAAVPTSIPPAGPAGGLLDCYA